MVLVDTSIWIRWFADLPPFGDEVDRLMDVEMAAGHELVFGELLVGDRGGRRKFLAIYDQMHRAAMVPHPEVVAFVRDQRLHGRGVGWIDIHLLASAIVGGMKVWTADPRFAEVARELGVAYHV